MYVSQEQVERTMKTQGMDKMQAIYHERGRNAILANLKRHDHRFTDASKEG